VTTDKCYENKEWVWGYRETDPLGGYDPYSSSKACAEIVSAAYRQSYFPTAKLANHGVAIATARAGNVIGGGDWSLDRLIPDLVRGFLAGEPVRIRRPQAIRPWQHVLEPLHGYIRLAEQLLAPQREQARPFATAYNFGPADDDARPVAWIAEKMTQFWGGNASWVLDSDESVHEAGYLKLDASRAKADLAWTPHLNLETALEWLVAWYRAWQSGADMQSFTLAQIAAYESLL
jgi:CDP-glucose 4,6-dehydratase